jgi:hypothetical protein
MKRALIITASLIVLLGIGVGAYFFFFAPDRAKTAAGQGSGLGNAVSSLVTTGNSIATGPNAGTVVAPNLVKVTDGPVALGFVGVDIQRPDPTVTVTGSSTPATVPDTDVRYIDRASGNIYSYTVHGRVLTRISNKTLPGVQEASWLPNGSMAFARYLSNDASAGDQIQTYALPASGNGGYFLEQNLAETAVQGSSTVFSLLASTNGSVGTVAKSDGTGAKTLFTSLLSSLLVYPSSGSYFAQTKASSQIDGYAFTISSGGTFTRILGPLRGLSILPSPSGKSLLYSYVDGSVVHLAVIDTTSHAATALPLGTLSEKCVWGPDSLSVYCGVPTNISGTLPDDWYQGAVSFSDRIWRIDLAQRVATLIIDPNKVANVSIDAVGLAIDPKSDALIFSDKLTGSLWTYAL